MPTVACPPTALSTQAVGAALLHQFLSDRFKEADLPKDLIQTAEQNLDDETYAMLLADDTQTPTGINTQGDLHNDDDDDDGGDEIRHNPPSPAIDNYCNQTSSSFNSTSPNSISGRTNTNSINIDQFTNSSMIQVYGRELRQIADEFARTSLRQDVRERANAVDFKNINREAFITLLKELFADGITRESIAVLFFFCTDVALRAASEAQSLVVNLLCWSFTFIIKTVCKKVEELGGWDNVLFKRVPKLISYGFFVVGILSFITFLMKR